MEFIITNSVLFFLQIYIQLVSEALCYTLPIHTNQHTHSKLTQTEFWTCIREVQVSNVRRHGIFGIFFSYFACRSMKMPESTTNFLWQPLPHLFPFIYDATIQRCTVWDTDSVAK